MFNEEENIGQGLKLFALDKLLLDFLSSEDTPLGRDLYRATWCDTPLNFYRSRDGVSRLRFGGALI